MKYILKLKRAWFAAVVLLPVLGFYTLRQCEAHLENEGSPSFTREQVHIFSLQSLSADIDNIVNVNIPQFAQSVGITSENGWQGIEKLDFTQKGEANFGGTPKYQFFYSYPNSETPFLFNTDKYVERGILKKTSKFYITLNNKRYSGANPSGQLNVAVSPAVIITDVPEDTCVYFNAEDVFRKKRQYDPEVFHSENKLYEDTFINFDLIPTIKSTPNLQGKFMRDAVTSPIIPLSRGCFKDPEGRIYLVRFSTMTLFSRE